MRISPRNKLILVAVAIAVVAVIAAMLLIVPQVRTIATINGRIQQAEKDVDAANALLMQRQEMKDRAAETDAAYLRLANQVPETPELPSLIIEVQDVALQSGVDLEGVRPADPISSTSSKAGTGQTTAQATAASTASTADYVVIPIEVSISGSWSDTIDFMNRIQRMTRAIRIVDYNTASNTGSSAEEQSSSSQTSEFTNFKLEAYTIPVATSGTGTQSTTGPVPTSSQQ
jgi:Tfp pilus assembly protein PilO